MKAANVSACAISVRLMFMSSPCGRRSVAGALAEWRRQRAGEGKKQRDAEPDDEGRVDQAQQQEHLGLQRIGELGLARGRPQETDSGARGPSPDRRWSAS